MKYLVHCDTHNCVDFQVIVGLTDNKNGLMEILFNYHKQIMKNNKDLTFEESNDDLRILKINDTDYDFILNEININMEKIEENYKIKDYEPERQQSNYLYVILCNDEDNYDIFDKKFHKKYYQILKRAKQLLV